MNDQRRLGEIIERYVDDGASAEEVQALEAALSSDANFRQDLIGYLNLDAALVEAQAVFPSASITTPMAPSWVSRMSVLVATVAMVVGGVLWFAGENLTITASLARLMATTNARWSDPNVELALNSGDPVTGPLRLELGRAEFSAVDGATVVIDGPACIRFADRTIVVVDEGRVFCHCPTPESRLSVIAPQTKIVDLGTEFAVDVRSAIARHGTDDALEHAATRGRSGHSVQIHTRGKHFPLVKQRVETGDIAGKVVSASAWAMSAANDPLPERQFAVLKIAFLDSAGREFACSTRHSLHGGYVLAEFAAQAPPSSCMVEVQLILAANRKIIGSVYFDDVELVVASEQP
jgi:hypothetical protein